jgi:surfeit locus 1 family protein
VRRVRTYLFAGIVFLLGVLCIRLGIWQLQRLEERRLVNATIRARLAEPSIELGGVADDPETILYRNAVATGQFDPAHEVVLLNRARGEDPGVHLITPLRFSDGSGAILVDRGWIPLEEDTPEAIAAYATEGTVRVTGLVREAEEEPLWKLLADRVPAPGEPPLSGWRVLNVEGIQAQVPYPLLPVYLELSEAPAGHQPVPDPILDLSEGPHFSYAIQWFGFAATAFVGGGLWLRRSLRANGGAEQP